MGWIISGNVPRDQEKQCQGVSCHFSSGISVQQQLEKFWTVEEGFLENRLSLEEQECETFFQNSVRRNNEGRFVVQLPFKECISELGESRETAEKRLEMLEKRFSKNKELEQQYKGFLQEYEKLGHMSMSPDLGEQGFGYFLPHHSVCKDASTTTKTRVVFDASAKTTVGCHLTIL